MTSDTPSASKPATAFTAPTAATDATPARFDRALAALPLIAILRGLQPQDAEGAGAVLHAAGFRLIEVPLNSPEPWRSIETLRRTLPRDTLIGAGTVMSLADLASLSDLCAELCVMPHADVTLIRAAKAAGLVCVPGVATPTEAFAALAAGAHALKLFPAEMITPTVLRSMRAVLPRQLSLLPVGGIQPASMAAYHAAGANGFGLGSALYRPGMNRSDLEQTARGFVAAWRHISPA